MKYETATVVFLHGVGLDHTMWAPIRSHFPSETVYLDLLGHGDQPPLEAATSLSAMGENISARLPAGPIQLVGFSLGGLIAQRLAIELPTKIVSVVAASSVCRRTSAERSAVMDRLETARNDFNLATQRSIARWYPHDTHAAAELIEHTRAVLHSNSPTSFLYAYEVFATADADLATELDQLHQPLLAITGGLDPGSTPEMSRRLAEAVPHGRLQIVEGARHMLPHEFPELFAKHVKDHFAFEEGADT